MKAITLGFKAFDPHELLCHFVALEAGLYRDRSLQVELVDITFVPETDMPTNWFQASCGAALSSAVKGIPQRVVFVAVDRPMFWLYARPGIDSLAGLKGQRLATFPAIAPPHHLANLILTRAGLDVAKEVSLRSARDDVARLGLLKSGHVDAAVISSAVAPPKLNALGFSSLCLFGDEIRIPTTGLAVDRSFLVQEPDAAASLVAAHRESLKLIHHDLALVARVLQGHFDVAAEHLEVTARMYPSCFTQNGTTTAEIAQAAVTALSKSLGVASPPDWKDIYRFD